MDDPRRLAAPIARDERALAVGGEPRVVMASSPRRSSSMVYSPLRIDHARMKELVPRDTSFSPKCLLAFALGGLLNIPHVILTDRDPNGTKPPLVRRRLINVLRLVEDGVNYTPLDADAVIARAEAVGYFVNTNTLEPELFTGGLAEAMQAVILAMYSSHSATPILAGASPAAPASGATTSVPSQPPISWWKISGSPVMQSISMKSVQIRLVHLWTKPHLRSDCVAGVN